MEYIAVGKLTQAHGTAGVLKAISYADIPERYLNLKTLYLDSELGFTGYIIDGVEVSGPGVLLKLRGVDDRDEAQLLAGSEIYLPETEKSELPDDAYFVYQLIGLQVFDTDGRRIGVLDDVLQQRGNDIYVVRDGDRELFMRRFVDGLSLKRISKETGLSLPALKSRFHRARLRLKAEHEEHAWRFFTGVELAA